MDSQDDAVSYIGLTLTDLYQRFGTPKSVYSSRGLEEWQDDVVFVYDQGDFYIYKDHVWQAGLKTMYGISVGDTRAQVNMVLSVNSLTNSPPPAIEVQGNSIFCSLPDKAWPMTLRCDFDSAGIVQAIFIYRTDL